MTNPYAPPQAGVDDISEPQAFAVPADRGTRLGAAILDSFVFVLAVYLPLMVTLFSTARMEVAPEEADQFERLAVGGAVVGLIGLVIWAWFTLKFMARNSQSIAKKWLRHQSGARRRFAGVARPPDPGCATSSYGLLSLIPLFGIVDVLFIFGESRQCLHDKIADTIVIKA